MPIGVLAGFVRNLEGRCVGGASVSVYLAGTSTPATLYTESSTDAVRTGLGSSTMTTDPSGRYACKAEFGEYDLYVQGPGLAAYWDRDRFVGFINTFTFGEADVRATPLTGLSAAAGGNIVATDTILVAFGRAQNRLAALEAAVPPDFTGATGGTGGAHGLVPAPVAGDQLSFLRGDATWAPAGGMRSTVTVSTGTLASGASESLPVTLPKSASILKLETDYPARVRLYLNATYRTNDAARLVTVDPSGDHGCVLEFLTKAGELTYFLSPVAVWGGISSGTTGYLAIENADTVSRAIALTLGLLSMEG